MLVIENLEVVYEDVILVLKGVSLEVPDGAIVALLGANGAGKTTVLRAITGLLDVHRGDITKGTITFEGEDLAGLDAPATVEAGVAQVMEGRRVFATFTVDENLRVGAHTAARGSIDANLDRVYTLFPVLATRRRQVAGYLSGGEQQMLAIGRALMAEPHLLLLDEPSLGLAPLIVREIFEIVGELRAAGVSILLVEQNARAALRVADYGYVLETGDVSVHGPSKDLESDPKVAATYLGAGAAHPGGTA